MAGRKLPGGGRAYVITGPDMALAEWRSAEGFSRKFGRQTTITIELSRGQYRTVRVGRLPYAGTRAGLVKLWKWAELAAESVYGMSAVESISLVIR